MTLEKPQKIKEIIPKINGIFGHMDYTFRAEVSKNQLDLIFFANYGSRNPSPVVEALQDKYGDALTSEELSTLAGLILAMYGEKWEKLGDIYDLEYDPIHNYLDEWSDTNEGEGTETTSGTGSRTDTYGHAISTSNTRTDNLSESVSGSKDSTNTRTDNLTSLETRDLENSSTRTDNLTETNTYGRTDTRTDNLTQSEDISRSVTGSGSETDTIYGFNSSAAVNANGSSTSDTNSETTSDDVTNTGTQTHALSGSDGTVNTGTQSISGTDEGTVRVANTGTRADELEEETSSTRLNTGTRRVEETVTNSGADLRAETTSGSKSTTDERNRSGQHFGNIGNITSQKMILEEINLWRWNYMQEILNDVKEFCTLPVYINPKHYQLVD